MNSKLAAGLCSLFAASFAAPLWSQTGENANFAIELYRHVANLSPNVVLSPSSVSTLLAMADAGAQGQTAVEMGRVLQLTGAGNRPSRNSSSGAILTIANSLWYEKDFALKRAYLRRVRSDFHAEIAPVDFADPGAATGRINRWVEAATRGRITGLLAPESVSSRTRMVLCDAVYFKGEWPSAFPTRLTRSEPFFVQPGQPKEVAMMHKRAGFRLLDEPDFRLLQLPYRGSRFSMVILLPKSPGGLKGIEEALTGPELMAWLDGLFQERRQEIDLSLPRFAAASGIDLSAALEGMGMSSAFDPAAADFSGMSEKEGIYLSAVVHQARIEVNEEGTVAAAATGGVMRAQAIRQVPAFRADHPFLFLILDHSSGTILFLGRIGDPK